MRFPANWYLWGAQGFGLAHPVFGVRRERGSLNLFPFFYAFPFPKTTQIMAYTIEQRDEQLRGSEAQIHYYLSFPQAGMHLLNVEMRAKSEGGDLVFAMPNWLPGSYKVRDFVAQQGNVRAFDASGNELPFEWLSKNRLLVTAAEGMEVLLRYVYYAHERTVRHSHINRFHAFLNPGNCLMFVEGRTDVIHHVHIDHPWSRVSTALSPVREGTWGALNYDILIDSPIEIGDHYVGEYERHGATHEVAITGAGDFDPDWITERTKEIIDNAILLWGGLPYDRYVFILHMLPDQYGGLEHARSQVSMFDSHSFGDRKRIGKFLALLTHEFFHTWNVKRLRPVELGPFNYHEENYTRMLWLAEGVTSYYDDLLSFRSGFYTRKEYLKILSDDHLNALLDVPGRLAMSIKDSSFLSWVKLYLPTPDSANRFPSYYLKGGVIMLLLDLLIVNKTEGEKSLDDGLRALYRRYEENPDTGITEEEFVNIVSAATDVDIDEPFLSWLNSTDELPAEELFRTVGLELKEKEEKEEKMGEGISIPSAEKVWLGLGLGEERGSLKVAKVWADSPAEQAGMGPDDEIIAANGIRVRDTKGWKAVLHSLSEGEGMNVLAACEGRMYETILTPEKRRHYQLVEVTNPTPEQKKKLEKWLGRK